MKLTGGPNVEAHIRASCRLRTALRDWSALLIHQGVIDVSPESDRSGPSELDERVADHLVASGADAVADDPTANRVQIEAGIMAPHLPDGSLSGLDLVQLQCHIGVDSISLARPGARVVGTDFSGEAIAAATKLADGAGVDASFVQTSNENAPEVLAREFEIVYTSVGVLAWLPDLSAWAKAVA
jgi:2-polyprenyl-3-methyl-5-hydroxy-6-metoxy-1,4-benzoquinol methylase